MDILCSACAGSLCVDTDNGKVDSGGASCSTYTSAACNQSDTAVFQSDTMCCVCGGGSSAANYGECLGDNTPLLVYSPTPLTRHPLPPTPVNPLTGYAHACLPLPL